MALFESLLALLLVSVVLLKISGHIGAPYPTMLAVAGACVAALPWAPDLEMEPRLALALFITPALLDAAYDLPPRELRREWLPLTSLAVVAVVLTTAVVAWAGWAFAGLPLAAAIALGAIVSPPDAAASAAVLARFPLPRRTLAILQGESLLNDAVSLLIFTAAVAIASFPETSIASMMPQLLLAAPGGVVVGLLAGKTYLHMQPWLGQTLTARIFEFITAFGTWVVAEHLRVSPILAVVAAAMLIAHYAPARQTARDRVHSYAIWEATVFVLNVLAFLLMGLQARTILSRLDGPALWRAIGFAAVVLALVVAVRLVWVMASALTARLFQRRRSSPKKAVPSMREVALISWCGMRGLVTLATAFALPPAFPGRDVIVLTAFSVVLGTLVMQGLTIGPMIKWLRIDPDTSLEEEVSFGRTAMINAAIGALANDSGAAAAAVRAEYEAMKKVARSQLAPQGDTEHDRLRMSAIGAQRQVIASLRLDGRITDEAFHRLEEELDWSELSASPRERLELLDA